jgi:hypothetical protein
MLGKYAAAYLVVVESIDGAIATLEKIPPNPPTPGSNDALVRAIVGKEAPLSENTKNYVRGVVESGASRMNKRIEMLSVTAQAKRIQDALNRDVGPMQIVNLLKELRTRIFDELTERQFLYVPPNSVKFFNEPMLFGKQVNELLSAAIDDIEEAGKCLALGRATACVLHTMRILEVGLKALAKALNIPYAPSWESYLKQISDQIAAKHKNKTAKWKREEKFYRDLSGDLLLVKQAWRNPTMHVDRKYGIDEAEQIFNAARIFMQRLAKHFDEKEIEKLL